LQTVSSQKDRVTTLWQGEWSLSYPWESAKSKATMRFRTVIEATGAIEIAPPVLPPAPTAKQDCDNPPYGADETRYRRFIDAFAKDNVQGGPELVRLP
jgi:hypothetical protein